jgi:hypothetical protein
MKTTLDCIPCFLRQALEAGRFVTSDPAVHAEIMQGVLAELSEIDVARSTPPAIGARVHRLVRQISGEGDPYGELKREFTDKALELLPELRRRVKERADPFTAALRLAAAGNIIDFGPHGSLTADEVESALERVEEAQVDEAAVVELRRAAQNARSVLYIADNAGEVVFDRLLLEQLDHGRVKIAVKGGPVINDATREDALRAGLAEHGEIIDTGADVPGAVLDHAGEVFRREFYDADLVIAKGQGNYEALSDALREVFFLLMIKCSVIADSIGTAMGNLYIGRRSGRASERTVAAVREED